MKATSSYTCIPATCLFEKGYRPTKNTAQHTAQWRKRRARSSHLIGRDKKAKPRHTKMFACLSESLRRASKGRATPWVGACQGTHINAHHCTCNQEATNPEALTVHPSARLARQPSGTKRPTPSVSVGSKVTCMPSVSQEPTNQPTNKPRAGAGAAPLTARPCPCSAHCSRRSAGAPLAAGLRRWTWWSWRCCPQSCCRCCCCCCGSWGSPGRRRCRSAPWTARDTWE